MKLDFLDDWKMSRRLAWATFTILAITSRFWRLGHSPFKADTLNFYQAALRNQNILELWRNPPWLNQIPLGETLSVLLVKAGLPATPFVTRLPFALMGVLALLFVWHFAHRWFGSRAARMVLLLAVFNPYQLYFSVSNQYERSAYLTWPDAATGTCWLIVLTDVNNNLYESNEANNEFAIVVNEEIPPSLIPDWWLERGVIHTNAQTNDFAMANLGQAKHVAKQAFLEFKAKLGGTSATILNLVSGFSTTGNYYAINLGQLKHLSVPFYDQLNALQLSNAWPFGMVVGPYPWSGSTNLPQDYSPANIGQLKYVFNFDLSKTNRPAQ